jgi:hypothetical protein
MLVLCTSIRGCARAQHKPGVAEPARVERAADAATRRREASFNSAGLIVRRSPPLAAAVPKLPKHLKPSRAPSVDAPESLQDLVGNTAGQVSQELRDTCLLLAATAAVNPLMSAVGLSPYRPLALSLSRPLSGLSPVLGFLAAIFCNHICNHTCNHRWASRPCSASSPRGSRWGPQHSASSQT